MVSMTSFSALLVVELLFLRDLVPWRDVVLYRLLLLVAAVLLLLLLCTSIFLVNSICICVCICMKSSTGWWGGAMVGWLVGCYYSLY